MTTELALRTIKGSPLTHEEVDSNFTNLRATADGAADDIASIQVDIETIADKANASAVGIASTANDLGTFTGSTIADASTAKAALQALETAVEGRALLADLASPSSGGGTELVAGTLKAERPEDYGAIADTTDQTAAIEATFAGALSKGTGRVDGGGKTYYVSQLSVTITDLIIDNMTLKEYAPNTGHPKTVTFTAQAAGSGTLKLGPNFKVDRSGDGTASNLDNSWGIQVNDVARVIADCEVYGNAKGSGLWVKNAIWFYDNSYVHDMLCSHSGVTDDIQHGSWAWGCLNVVTKGLVRHIGSLDRTSSHRDRYNRGRAYSGCGNIELGGAVGPGIDQAYDVTGDLNNGNSCVRLNGAHADYPFSTGFKFANAVLASTTGCATVREPGLCGVMVSGPDSALVNMTRWAMIKGVTQIGGGSNQFWSPEASVVRLNVGSASAPMNAYPKGVHVTNNMYCWPEGSVPFTVADTDELTPVLSSDSLNVHDCARVRLTTSGTLPSGLATGTDYWIALKSNGNFQLANSFINAQDGTFIAGISGGSGTHTVTVQNDCNYGVLSEVSQYDKEAPNLVYDNAFGPITASHVNIKRMYASVTNSAAQSIPNNSGTFVEANAETDPYGLVVYGSGYVEFTIPYESNNWTLFINGEWASGGSASTYQYTNLRMDTGSGFVDVPGYLEKQPGGSTPVRQSVRWSGYAPKNSKARFELKQTSGSAKDYTLKALYLEEVR